MSRQSTLEALARSMTRGEDSERVGEMPEDVRGLAMEFGRIFNLWPPRGDTKGDKKLRGAWAEWLRQNRVTADGESLNPVPYWRRIAIEGRILVARPLATVLVVRGMHAEATRDNPGMGYTMLEEDK